MSESEKKTKFFSNEWFSERTPKQWVIIASIIIFVILFEIFLLEVIL